MKRKLIFLLYLSAIFLIHSCNPESDTGARKHFKPPVSFAKATQWADSVLGLMTTDEKISFIGGDSIFFTQAIPRLGIPAVMMADATQGVHLRDEFGHGEYVFKKALPKSTFGGGPGMVMRPDVVHAALESVADAPGPVIYLTPRGRPLDQAMVRDFARGPGMTVLCGRYEGVDERLLVRRVDEELSLGDFVLSMTATPPRH